MDEGIKKGKDVKLNIRPVTVTVYHDYVFEGPCRFGKGDQLTKDFELMRNEQQHRNNVAAAKEHLGKLDFVNIMDDVIIKRDETFPLTDELLAEMAGPNPDDVDLYMVFYIPFGVEFVMEFARRYNKPIALVHSGSNDSSTIACLRAIGREGFCWYNWDAAIHDLKALRARKVMRNTKALCIVRANSTNSVSTPDSFHDHRFVTEKLGMKFHYYNLHEFLDQSNEVDPSTNPTLPGRKALNINAEDRAEIEKMTRELMDGAAEIDMTEDDVYRSVRMNYLVNKLLKRFECNAFTAPCPDMCATRRLNEGRVTLCLNHSLNNERGICSACEYDVSALASMILLSAMSNSAPYMGNTSVSRKNADEEMAVAPLMKRDKEMMDAATAESVGVGDLAYTFHAAPNRKLKGYDEPLAAYGLRPFAMGGRWGATIRYDFSKDKGQVITMCRFDPTCKKLFLARGTIVAGVGYRSENCSEGVLFQVKDLDTWFENTLYVGNHIPLVYGDVYDDIKAYCKLAGLEVLDCG